jgi:hypothetical protein
MMEMRTEKEVREQLEKLRRQRRDKGPFIESKNIAWHAAKQSLEWVLEEAESALTYQV